MKYETYGDKRDYKKIDIYLRNLRGMYAYECSTTWSKTCKEAKQKFLYRHNYLDATQVRAVYAKD